MNCKNCGARLKDDAKVCRNCGAFIDDSSGYVLLTSNDKIDDFYSDYKAPEKKHSGLKFFIVIILVLLIAGGGSYVYFTYIAPMMNKAPEVSFSAGSGVINGGEKIVYVTIDNNSNIEFIHGAELLEGENVLTADYEYTKNVDSSFRAIFFDLEKLSVEKGKEYNYTFSMKFSFIGSEEIYSYTYPVIFSGTVEKDASDIIFDHSMLDESETQAQTDNKAKAKTTTEKKEDYGFINEGYWFTSPVTHGESREISSLRFKSDGTYTLTKYKKEGSASWKVTSEKGEFKRKDNKIMAGDMEIVADADKKTLTDSDGQKLTPRKYNSIKNAEDFFGI